MRALAQGILGIFRILRSSVAASASLACALAIAMLGALGPIFYPVDPDAVFYVNRAGALLVSPDGKVERSLDLGGIEIEASESYEGGILVLGPSGALALRSHGGEIRLERAEARGLGGLSGTAYAKILDGDVYIVDSKGSVYAGKLGMGSLELSQIPAPGGLGGRIVGAAGAGGSVFVWTSSGELAPAAGPGWKLDIGFRPSDGAFCGGLLVLVGEGGRIALVDVSTPSAGVLRPVYEDLLRVICRGGTALAVGKFGSAVLISGGSARPLGPGPADDLVDVAVAGDVAVAVGARGSLEILDLGGVVKGIGEIRGVENVRRASWSEGRLLLLFHGRSVDSLSPPSWAHPFGTNYHGKDLLAQVMAGIRTSALIGLAVAALVTLTGSLVGLLSGYFRGRVDAAFAAVINFVYTIPLEPFAIILAMAMKPGTLTVILAISALIWRTTARIVRSQAMAAASTPMVEAARALGAGHGRIIYKYILPSVLPLLLLDFASVVAYAILAEASLGFLGVGAQDAYTLGNMLNQARLTGAWRLAWWWILFPGIFISALALSIYSMARALEPLANPRLRDG